jgi:tRNA-dihydrouridine synthase A
VDDQDPEASLRALLDVCARAGTTTFIVHARKAWLGGISPKENREVPPLDYPLVYRIRRENPQLTIVLNGGVATLDDAARHLPHVDGVMMGRAAYRTPALLAQIDSRFFDEPSRDIDEAVQGYVAYVEQRLAEGVPLHAMTRHTLGLFNGRPGARHFRRYLSEHAVRPGAGIGTLHSALECLGAEEPESDRIMHAAA